MSDNESDSFRKFENLILSEEEWSDIEESDEDAIFDGVVKEYDDFNKEFPFFVEKNRAGGRIQQVLRMIKPRLFQVYNAAEKEGKNVFVSHRMKFEFTNPTNEQVNQVRCRDLSDHFKGPDELKIKLLDLE